MSEQRRILGESDARLESFHDCHVHGLRWCRSRFTFSLDLQYILEWIEPRDPLGSYTFSIAEARLTFHHVDDLKLSMDWSGTAFDAQIDAVRALETRTTPSGAEQRHFEIELAEPDGVVSLWSTGYEVELLAEPVISSTPSLPAGP